MGEQYTNTTDLFGIGVDINVFDADYLGGGDMTPEQLAKLDGLGILTLEAFRQINDLRGRVSQNTAGIGEVLKALISLGDRVNNTIGGNPQQFAAFRAAVNGLEAKINALEIKDAEDRAAFVAVADTLKLLAP
jgi:hypothetical protein